MNKLNIKEANEHLKQLHRKVFELENQVHMHTLHTQELERTNAELRKRLKATEQSRERELAAKEAQNAEVLRQLHECENRVDILLKVAEEHDRLVENLEKKARLFYEVVEHRAALGRMVEILDELHRQDEIDTTRTSPAKMNGEVNKGMNGRTLVSDGDSHSSTSNTSDRQPPSVHDVVMSTHPPNSERKN